MYVLLKLASYVLPVLLLVAESLLLLIKPKVLGNNGETIILINNELFSEL